MKEIDTVGQYVESALVAVAASFPVFASVATGWNEYKNIKQAEYIKDVLESFAERLSRIETTLLDKEFLGSDEMKKLIEQTIFKSKDELMSEKRKHYAEFLKNSATKALSSDSEKSMVLETISKLSVAHIARLNESAGLINSSRNSDTYLGLHGDRQTSDNDIEIANLDYMLAVGVFELDIHRDTIQKPGIRSYTLSNLGWCVYKYLKQN
jgi:hypothetical protein